MSQTRAQLLNPLNGNLNVSGIITAASFSGDGSGLTGVASTDNIRTATDANFLANVSIGGSLTVNGTFTRINTQVLDIADKTVGVASTSTKTALTQDGGGLVIYGPTDIELTYSRDKVAVGLNTNLSVAGVVTATSFRGDGSQLTGVVSGVELKQAGASVGTALTVINFASGATLTGGSGIGTVTIAAGIGTEAATPNNTITFLDLGKQDHKLTVSGITTISCTGGTEGDSHTVRIVNSGIATVGFSTYFLFPSGSPPVLPTTSGAISLVSFTVHRVGTAGTQLLAGASLNFS